MIGLFDFLRGPDINQGIKEYHETKGAVLVDVRTPQEYQEGHIPDSKNIPLQELGRISTVAPEKNVPLFVYCRSGARSQRAMGELQHMGYTSVKNIGGIIAYTGKVESVSKQ